MRVLILGGDGFCGRPTSLHLSERGHDVTIVWGTQLTVPAGDDWQHRSAGRLPGQSPITRWP